MQQVNSFQVSILKWLNLFLGRSMSIEYQKSAWLTGHLTDTEENVDSWIQQLVEDGYILEEFKETAAFVRMMSVDKDIAPTFSLFIITQKGRNFLASLETVEIENELSANKPTNENEKPALNHLDCLKGKWEGIKIMTDKEHEKLVEYTGLILDHIKLPKQIKKISKQSTLPFEFIRKTFHLIYLQNGRVPKTNVWVDFLHSAFELKETKATTKNNFPTYRGDYESTKAAISGY